MHIYPEVKLSFFNGTYSHVNVFTHNLANSGFFSDIFINKTIIVLNFNFYVVYNLIVPIDLTSSVNN